MTAYPQLIDTPPSPRYVPVWDLPFCEGLRLVDPLSGSKHHPDGDATGPAAGATASPRVAIQLFVSPDSPTCAAARRNIERALGSVEQRDVRLEICDVSEQPHRAAEAHVCFTPTLLIRAADQPPVWIFGALTDTEVLTEHLEVAGVQITARGN
jgi:hypothetical protein